MAMTRKDYQLIADSLNKQAESIYGNNHNDNMTKFLYSLELLSVRNRLAFDFIGTNPNYDRNKFYEATKRVDEIQALLYEGE